MADTPGLPHFNSLYYDDQNVMSITLDSSIRGLDKGANYKVSSVARQAFPLVQAFRRMINQRQVEVLDTWLHQAETSGIIALRRFATSLRSDYQAVKAALVYPWSNGPVEGHVHRLKLIKRQMYGRASFALLRSRVLSSLRAAPAEP